jgi:hypothetical protein
MPKPFLDQHSRVYAPPNEVEHKSQGTLPARASSIYWKQFSSKANPRNPVPQVDELHNPFQANTSSKAKRTVSRAPGQATFSSNFFEVYRQELRWLNLGGGSLRDRIKQKQKDQDTLADKAFRWYARDPDFPGRLSCSHIEVVFFDFFSSQSKINVFKSLLGIHTYNECLQEVVHVAAVELLTSAVADFHINPIPAAIPETEEHRVRVGKQELYLTLQEFQKCLFTWISPYMVQMLSRYCFI